MLYFEAKSPPTRLEVRSAKFDPVRSFTKASRGNAVRVADGVTMQHRAKPMQGFFPFPRASTCAHECIAANHVATHLVTGGGADDRRSRETKSTLVLKQDLVSGETVGFQKPTTPFNTSSPPCPPKNECHTGDGLASRHLQQQLFRHSPLVSSSQLDLLGKGT